MHFTVKEKEKHLCNQLKRVFTDTKIYFIIKNFPREKSITKIVMILLLSLINILKNYLSFGKYFNLMQDFSQIAFKCIARGKKGFSLLCLKEVLHFFPSHDF